MQLTTISKSQDGIRSMVRIMKDGKSYTRHLVKIGERLVGHSLNCFGDFKDKEGVKIKSNKCPCGLSNYN